MSYEALPAPPLHPPIGKLFYFAICICWGFCSQHLQQISNPQMFLQPPAMCSGLVGNMCMAAVLTLGDIWCPQPHSPDLENMGSVNWPLAPAISSVEFLGLWAAGSYHAVSIAATVESKMILMTACPLKLLVCVRLWSFPLSPRWKKHRVREVPWPVLGAHFEYLISFTR